MEAIPTETRGYKSLGKWPDKQTLYVTPDDKVGDFGESESMHICYVVLFFRLILLRYDFRYFFDFLLEVLHLNCGETQEILF